MGSPAGFGDSYRAISTEQGASLTIRAEVLPTSSRSTAPCPRLPTIVRSIFCRAIIARILLGRMALSDNRLGGSKNLRQRRLKFFQIADGLLELLVVLLLPGLGHRLRRPDRAAPACSQSGNWCTNIGGTTLITQPRAPSGQESFPASAAIRSPNSDPSYAASTRNVPSGVPAIFSLSGPPVVLTTSTGTRAVWTTARLTLPSRNRSNNPVPRKPTAISSAPLLIGRLRASSAPGRTAELQPLDARLPLVGQAHHRFVEHGAAQRRLGPRGDARVQLSSPEKGQRRRDVRQDYFVVLDRQQPAHERDRRQRIRRTIDTDEHSHPRKSNRPRQTPVAAVGVAAVRMPRARRSIARRT